MNDYKIYVPPLKIQGIKTKLVPIIKQYVILKKDTLWIEPFFGSGVVGFNVAPTNAVFADTNPHIINFYQQIQNGTITSYIVRDFLEHEGFKLAKHDVEYYLEVRTRFNLNHDPLDFLFLNRSCFNGMMRFNRNNDFNVPFGHKPERFAKSYITKIVNQVSNIETLIQQNNWQFVCQSFEETISLGTPFSFIYCDPPYIGRHVDYFDSWNEECEINLCKSLHKSSSKFMLSTWDKTAYRKNEHIYKIWKGCYKITKEHFYHVGAKENNRNAVTEALLLNYLPQEDSNKIVMQNKQITLF